VKLILLVGLIFGIESYDKNKNRHGCCYIYIRNAIYKARTGFLVYRQYIKVECPGLIKKRYCLRPEPLQQLHGSPAPPT